MTQEFTPVELESYIGDTLNKEILYWYLQADATSDASGVPDHQINLQVDDSSAFTSPEDFVIDLTSDNAIDGNLIEGALYSFTREEDEQTKYWRVRNVFTDATGDWSDIASFTIFADKTTFHSDAMLDDIPDEVIYKKDAKTTNIYKILSTYGSEFDKSDLEGFLTKLDLSLDNVRDSRVYNIFGYLFSLRKTIDMVFPEYRELLRKLMDLSFYGGTYKAIKDICRFFTGVDPTITLIRDLDNEVVIGSDATGVVGDVTGSFMEDVTGGIIADYIWSEDEMATGFVVLVINKYNFDLDEDLITEVLKLLKPGNAKIYIQGLSP